MEADRIEHDVEHFRPKASIARWDVPAHLREELRAAGFRVNQPHRGSEPGYRLLAYHILNYATVCKECNSVLKRNLFPITGKRSSDARDPTKLASEGALLIYPLGSHDADPEDLIEFCGASPQVRAVSGHDRLRALVTIEVFGLDDWRGRRSLILDRMEWVEKLLWALQRRHRGQDASNARKAIERLTSTTFRHANCLRSFRRLYEKNPVEAERLYEEKIRPLLESYSPAKGLS